VRQPPSTYATTLLQGVAGWLASLELDGEPLATYRADLSDYQAGDVRPIYHSLGTESVDESWVVAPGGMPVFGANNTIESRITFTYRGARNGSALRALDMIDILDSAMRPQGRPYRGRFGTVPIGNVKQDGGGQLATVNAQQRQSRTYLFRGKRQTT
jgi:hypothetical protein